MMEMRNTRKYVARRNQSNGKRGFTLVELAVVLVLIVLIVGLVASFVTVTNRFVHRHNQALGFAEEATDVRDALTLWLSNADTAGAIYRVTADGTLFVNGDPLVLADGTLALGALSLDGVTHIEAITFAANEKVIRCTVSRTNANKEQETFSFLLAPRSAELLFEEVAG